jgi:hypothetical protein
MKKLITLFGLLPPLAELFLTKYNYILARLNVLALKYGGVVEIKSNREIMFKFPLTGDDIVNNINSGTVVFYFAKNAKWKCSFGPGNEKCYYKEATALFFEHYYPKYHPLFQEFRYDLSAVKANSTLFILNGHFENLKKQMCEGFEELDAKGKVA